MVSEKFNPPAPPVGIIESLTSGFETVAAHLPLLLLPLMIDLVLWMGPRITYRPVIAGVDQVLEPLIQQAGQDAVQANADLVQALQDGAKNAPDIYLPVQMLPTLLNSRESAPLPLAFKPLVIDTLSGALIATGLALVGGVVLWAIYMGLIAGQIRDGRISPGRIGKQMLPFLIQIGFLIIALTVLVLVGLFFLAIIFGILAALGLNLAGDSNAVGVLQLLILFLIVIPVGAFLNFTVNDMLLYDRHIFAAMWDSLRVFQWNFSGTLGLFYLMFLISTTLRYVWELPGPGSWLTLAAMGGNAFISTGLTAATFVFFKDRYRYWLELRQQLLAELERRRARQQDESQPQR